MIQGKQHETCSTEAVGDGQISQNQDIFDVPKALPQTSLSTEQVVKVVVQQKLGLLDQMWAAFIRPSSRINYNKQSLGPKNFMLNGKVFGTRDDFSVINSRGFRLQCSYFEPTDIAHYRHPCVMYLHGNSSSMLEGIPLLGYCLPYGMSLLVLDFSGCGMSQGEFISLGYFEKQDVKKVMDYVRQWKEVTEFGLWGRSMGAATAIMTALQEDDQVRYIVLDSCFVSARRLCREIGKLKVPVPNCLIDCAFGYARKKVREKAQFDLNDCNVLELVQNTRKQNLPCVLFLSGKQDNLIPPSHSQEIYEHYQGPKQIVLFEGTHNSRRPVHIHQQIASFFYKGLFDQYATKKFRPTKVLVDPMWIYSIPNEENKSEKDKIIWKETSIVKEEDEQSQIKPDDDDNDDDHEHSIKLEFKEKPKCLKCGKCSQNQKFQEESRLGTDSNCVSSQIQMVKKLKHNQKEEDEESYDDSLTYKIKILPKKNEPIKINSERDVKLNLISVIGEVGSTHSTVRQQNGLDSEKQRIIPTNHLEKIQSMRTKKRNRTEIQDDSQVSKAKEQQCIDESEIQGKLQTTAQFITTETSEVSPNNQKVGNLDSSYFLVSQQKIYPYKDFENFKQNNTLGEEDSLNNSQERSNQKKQANSNSISIQAQLASDSERDEKTDQPLAQMDTLNQNLLKPRISFLKKKNQFKRSQSTFGNNHSQRNIANNNINIGDANNKNIDGINRSSNNNNKITNNNKDLTQNNKIVISLQSLNQGEETQMNKNEITFAQSPPKQFKPSFIPLNL